LTKLIQTDVLVIGGGAAGIAAAIAAKRKGAKVVLLEQNSFWGGKATAAIVGTLCGLYLRNKSANSVYASNGFAKEFADQLQKLNNSTAQSNSEGLHYLPYHPFNFKYLSDSLLIDSRVDLFLHTSVTGCDTENNAIKFVNTIAFDTKIVFEPSTVIDCSGEAIISHLADIEVDESEEYQAAAQVFSVHQVESTNEMNLSLIILRELAKAVENKILLPDLAKTSIVPGSLVNNSLFLKIALPFKISPKVNSVTAIEMESRKLVAQLFSFLKSNVAAFKNALIGEIASEAGIRTGRRPIGRYTLTEDDVLTCKKFPSGIANGSWPIEYWAPGEKVKMTYFNENDYYQIPADALRSKYLNNLYFAGRNISASNEAIASARVIGTCLQTGFAAGQLAAAQKFGHSYESEIEAIRKNQLGEN
jgi:hypothetical protein